MAVRYILKKKMKTTFISFKIFINTFSGVKLTQYIFSFISQGLQFLIFFTAQILNVILFNYYSSYVTVYKEN